jgi:hypothetical protein
MRAMRADSLVAKRALGAVFFLASGIGLAIWDWHRATQPNPLVDHQQRNVVIGAVVALSFWVLLGLVTLRPRRRLTPLAVAGFLLSVGLWIYLHPRHGTAPGPSTTTKAFLLGCSVGLDLTWASLVIWLTLRGRRTLAEIRQSLDRPPGYVCDKSAEIWHVSDSSDPPAFRPYYVAHCECHWIGNAIPDEDEEAEQQARAEAHQHSTNVAEQVVELP